MINAKTKVIGLIGHPVEHSFSPIMHNAAFKDKGLNYVYVAFDVLPENLKYVIDGAKALGIVGFNVTIPHKIEIMKYLDEIDKDAQLIGAVNTIKIEDGKAIGYNTDGIGARMALEEEIGRVKDKNIVIYGAGGAARAVAFELAKDNNIIIANRTVEKAEALAKEIAEKLNKKFGEEVKFSGLDVDLDGVDIIINATPIGMYPNIDVEPIVKAEKLREDMVVMDLIYNPLETVLLKEAKKVNAKTINGLGMLIYQGAVAFKIWTGVEPNIEVMKNAIIDKITK
ncbi:TPA: shikimate dehydrogenase [Methanocaldococcus jannaschii]|uniref:Shikimate dehydrogenase (NADP(+)) n=3 Tax=Methanocaldococcus jannaschii TaxID=2190 RepID=AROE_METJA|nr:shikimate dehydrogenase [Methanocaldococcus jannaschii]Q58484.1 RecName: Full=Shikimate dehydrogenase (NADP(+)); Short=SDH [Methanocaldococcus jannaschii DSM 2661]AAB99086.1 shikimate 5-dehydrogenase (aroE) [Methanocaldococcus jannaschii DSM 2661]HII59486.1 shikimate dehydrogenase [Methanocaldococcus jannaschii]